MAEFKDYNKYLFLGFLALFFYISYLIVQPFIAAMLTSGVLAYMFYPLYERVQKKIKNRTLSAIIVSALIIMIITIPFIFLLNSISQESQVIYIQARQIFTTGDVFKIGCAQDDPEIAESTACRITGFIGGYLGDPGIRYHLEQSIKRATDYVSQKASEFVFSLPSILLSIFVTFFTTFYLFKDGNVIMEKFKKLIPLKLHHQKQLFQQLDESLYAIIYGSLLIAAVQGATGAIGFFVFGVNSPITWGIAMAVFALIPFLGAAFVWFPVSLVIIVQGLTTGSDSTVLRGIGLMIFGVLIVSSVDNLIKPYIIGKKGKMHPIIVLVGVLGGLAVFGFIGFIIGPIALAVFLTLLDIYEREKSEGTG